MACQISWIWIWNAPASLIFLILSKCTEQLYYPFIARMSALNNTAQVITILLSHVYEKYLYAFSQVVLLMRKEPPHIY